MAQQDFVIGTENGGGGDTPPVAFQKAQDNFDELYESVFPEASQVVHVYSADDLPTPISGIINLDSSTVYEFRGSVSFGDDRINMGSNTVVRGAGSLAIVLSYTGSSTFIIANDTPCVIAELTIVATTSGARVVDYSTTSLKIIRIDDCTIVCDRFASFSGVDWAARLTNVSVFPYASGAITCAGTCRSFNYNTAGVIAATGAGVFLDLGSCVFESGVVRTIVGEFPTGSTFISGLTASANVSSTGRFYVDGCQLDISGGGVALSGVTEEDSRWKFSNNTPMMDTIKDFLIYFSGNTANNTAIAVAGTYYKVNSGASWIQDSSSGFSSTTDGRVTYVGVEDIRVPVDIAISMEPALGGAVDLAVKLAKNGTVVGPEIRQSASAGSPAVITIPWQIDLSANDYLEVFVTNVSSTNDVLVGSCILRGN